ncbi:MAG: RNA degradosome polyphosphate kinase, partial [Pseudorhodobacter sp.]|nr:RNA degradosome polyphosphate kinase [Pseudorhodobacter sp.]
MTQADFLKSPFPEAVAVNGSLATSPRRFFNRELSWLAFNWRVLEEASNPGVPLLERLRFLSISATNLDEFYTVRVAGLRALLRGGKTRMSEDGRSPGEQLTLINDDARHLLQTQQVVLNKLKKQLDAQGITIVTRSKLTTRDLKHLEPHFIDNVFPILSPLAIDPAHPFPFIPNTGFCLALELQRASDKRALLALLPIPQQIDRFVPLPAKHGENRFLLLEELLLLHLDVLFPGYTDKGHCTFRVLRDSDLEVEDEAEDLVREFETALKRRRRGEVIRLKISAGAPQELRALIMQELHVTTADMVEVRGLLGVADLKELVLDSRKDLQWPKFIPRIPERVQDHE